MRIIQAYNRHRYGGGSDSAADATYNILRERRLDVRSFIYDSKDLAPGFRGRWKAFTNGLYARVAIRRFAELVHGFRPDVVHVHELYPLISPWILPICSQNRIPVVMTCHDYRLSCPVATHFSHGKICTRCIGGREYWCVLKNCRSQYLESLAFALRATMAHKFKLFTDHVAMFITPTGFARQWLVQHAGLPADRVVTIPYIIDIPSTSIDASQGQYIAFVGRFVPEKGINTLVRAARNCGLPLRLAGDSSTMPLLPIDVDIQTVGLLNKAQLFDFYQRARMLVVPSTWFETFGIVAGEAMSHGVPVIASRIGALQEVVEDGVSGVLFEPGNDYDLATKLKELWDKPQICRKLGKAGRKKILRECNKDTYFERLIAVYEEATGLSSSL